MNKIPIAALLGVLFATGIAAAALPDSFESESEFNQAIDSYESQYEFMRDMQYACENAYKEHGVTKTTFSITATDYIWLEVTCRLNNKELWSISGIDSTENYLIITGDISYNEKTASRLTFPLP